MMYSMERKEIVSGYPIFYKHIRKETGNIQSSGEYALYIHLPFCNKICGFCCYNKSNIYNEDLGKHYINFLIKEMKILTRQYDRKIPIKAIFLGGGTPTAFDIDLIERLLCIIYGIFEIKKDAQICIEAKPHAISNEYLCKLKNIGINRISFGLQSDSDAKLERLYCNHTFNDFQKIYDLARNVGFNNINIDLMYNLPNQNVKEWLETVSNIVEKFNPEHLSCYQLQRTSETRIFKERVELPFDHMTIEDKISFIRETKELLERYGYSIDRFDECSKKNKKNEYSIVGLRGETVGVGLGAMGYFDGYAYQNENDWEHYVNKIEKGILPINSGIDMRGVERQYRYMALFPYYLQVRKEEYYALFGENIEDLFGDSLEILVQQGMLEEKIDRYCLTIKGYMEIPEISSMFFSPEQKRYLAFSENLL